MERRIWKSKYRNKENAFILAEKLRTTIENSCYRDKEFEIQVTISLGISELQNDDEELDSIISRADKALYRAKNESRNKTVIYS